MVLLGADAQWGVRGFKYLKVLPLSVFSDLNQVVSVAWCHVSHVPPSPGARHCHMSVSAWARGMAIITCHTPHINTRQSQAMQSHSSPACTYNRRVHWGFLNRLVPSRLCGIIWYLVTSRVSRDTERDVVCDEPTGCHVTRHTLSSWASSLLCSQ